MKPKRNLKWFLIISLLLAILLPILLIGGIFANVLTSSLRKNIIAGNESLSQSFVYQIEAYLDQSLRDLKSLRTMIEKQDFEMIHFNSLLDSVRQNKDHFTKIQIINNDGITRFVSPFDPEFIDIDLSESEVFKQTVRTKKPYWSNTFISLQSNQPVVSVSIPYINGVITGYLSLQSLIEAAKQISQGDDMLITMTDQTSAFIVHHRDNMVFERGYDPLYNTFKNKHKSRIFTTQVKHEGEPMFATASLIEQTEWIIVFYRPVKTVFAPIRTVYSYLTLAAVIIIITTTLLCLRHIQSIIRVLNRITQSAQVMTKGHYDERITKIEYQEFGSLAKQFNTMAEAIESRQHALAENEEKYRSIFIAAQDAIILVDADSYKIIDVNDFATCLYGYDWKHFLSLTLSNICDEKDDTPVRLSVRESWRSVNHHKKKEGVIFPVEVSGSFYQQMDGKQICTLVIRDITQRIEQEMQRQQMEIQLSQARKMEAIGTLAGGIAHDFNNILGAIIGFSELALSSSQKGSSQERHIQKILAAGNRATELVRQILLFARSSDREKKPVRLKDITKEVVALIRASIPSFIDIQVNIESQSLVMADPIELHQVLMNLCTNAWHAMKDKSGILTITLKETDSPPKLIPEDWPKVAARYALLSVADTGHGISKENLQKIFDPYFTTKGVGDGSGMGLSVVQGIIRSIDGLIDVESELDVGTCFTICLPVFEETIPDQETFPSSLRSGSETILIVDDEEMITLPTARNLEALGYTPLPFTDAQKALDAVDDENIRVDLVITDLTMPKMTGLQLAEKINQRHPDMPIILCSGYMESSSMENAGDCGIRAFISKPVTREELSRKIREVLDQ